MRRARDAKSSGAAAGPSAGPRSPWRAGALSRGTGVDDRSGCGVGEIAVLADSWVDKAIAGAGARGAAIAGARGATASSSTGALGCSRPRSVCQSPRSCALRSSPRGAFARRAGACAAGGAIGSALRAGGADATGEGAGAGVDATDSRADASGGLLALGKAAAGGVTDVAAGCALAGATTAAATSGAAVEAGGAGATDAIDAAGGAVAAAGAAGDVASRVGAPTIGGRCAVCADDRGVALRAARASALDFECACFTPALVDPGGA
jgi:hypothetical protein